MAPFFKNDNVKLTLWLLCAGGGVLALWLGPNNTWAGAGALAAALALGLLFFFQKGKNSVGTPSVGTDLEVSKLQEGYRHYKGLSETLVQSLKDFLGPEAWLPPGLSWEDPQFAVELQKHLEIQKKPAVIGATEWPELKDLLALTRRKMKELKESLENSLAKNDSATHDPLDGFSGLRDLAETLRRGQEDLIPLVEDEETWRRIEELQKESLEVSQAFEHQSKDLQDFHTAMDMRFQKLTGALKSLQGNLNSILDVPEQNSIIAINASIEASKMGQKGAGFKVLVAEIIKTNDKIKNFITQSGELIQQLRDYNEELSGEWNGEFGGRLGDSGTTKGFSVNADSAAAQTFGSLKKALARERQSSGEILRRLEKLLTGLPTQNHPRLPLEDVIRQVAEIEETLGDFQNALGPSPRRKNS